MGRPAFTCDGNHAALTPPQLRTHNLHDCRDDDTRKAANDYKAERLAAKHREATETRQAGPASTDAAPEPSEPATPAPVPAPTPKPGPPNMVDTVPSTGAARRLQSLTNLGHTPKDLASHTGLSVDSIWRLLILPPERIQTPTHSVVATAFNRLRIEPKPLGDDTAHGRAATWARALAELHDWAGPYDWEEIDRATCEPAKHRISRDPVALAKAVAEATLDAVDVVADVDLAEQLRSTKLTLEYASASRRQTLTDLETLRAAAANTQKQLDTVRSELEVARAVAKQLEEERDNALLAGEKLAKEVTASIDERGAFEFPAIVPGTIDFGTIETELFAPHDMTITIDPTPHGGIRLTLPSKLISR